MHLKSSVLISNGNLRNRPARWQQDVEVQKKKKPSHLYVWEKVSTCIHLTLPEGKATGDAHQFLTNDSVHLSTFQW